MIAFRDVLIFAGLVALAAAVIASLFPVGEGVSAVPACSDCAFKLTGGYWIRQYGNYASLYLGTREVARYGWAYVDGRPLGVGETVRCDPLYVHVLNGMAYVSCSNINSTFGRRVPPLPPLAEGITTSISADPMWHGCIYRVNVTLDIPLTVSVKVYDERGRRIYSASAKAPATFTIYIYTAGTYRMHIYAPPFFDKWYTLHGEVVITGTNIAVYRPRPSEQGLPDNTISFPQDLRPNASLKIIDLTEYFKRYSFVKVRVNPAKTFDISGWLAFAEFLLAWEDCSNCDESNSAGLYADEVWRLAFTYVGYVNPPAIIDFDEFYLSGNYWHWIYADGQLVTVRRADYVRLGRYFGRSPTITVKFVSEDPKMNAEATFTKVCRWS